jgi:hypothetical protein
MDPIEKRELKRKAWMRLAAQRRRAGLLRGRVVVLSLLCFAILWGAVFIQMITGNDPVLAAKGNESTRTVASAKERVKKAKRRALGPHHKHHEVAAGGDEGEAEPEIEEPAATEVEVGPELEEAGATEAAEVEAAEIAEAEAREIEAAEIEAREIEAAEIEAAEFEEPLVTSQS